jgi:uncharacterized protein YlxW (UPF0749 family)
VEKDVYEVEQHETAYSKIKRLAKELKQEQKESYYLRKEVRILTAYLKKLDPKISRYGR